MQIWKNCWDTNLSVQINHVKFIVCMFYDKIIQQPTPPLYCSESFPSKSLKEVCSILFERYTLSTVFVLDLTTYKYRGT